MSDFGSSSPPPLNRRRKAQPVDLKKLTSTLGLGAIGIFLIVGALTSWDFVEPGEVAVIKNNVFGGETVQTESGLILHLPYGLTDVYKLDRSIQVFSMTKSAKGGDRASIDNVRIKVADGSNIEVDVEVNYKIIPLEAAAIVREVGEGEAFKTKMIRSYTRAFIREKYGTLTLETVSDPSTRTIQNNDVRNALNSHLSKFGIEVTLVNTSNFSFNHEYEKLVRKKKSTVQEYRNQSAAQDQVLKEQETQVAQTMRLKNNALIKARGLAQKRIVEADNRAKQLIARAEGEAYSLKKQGDRLNAVSVAEAQAVEQEGLNTATGIRKLAEAYSGGGVGLVKESLAKKLLGARIHGRPYSLSEKIDRIQVENKKKAAAASGKK